MRLGGDKYISDVATRDEVLKECVSIYHLLDEFRYSKYSEAVALRVNLFNAYSAFVEQNSQIFHQWQASEEFHLKNLMTFLQHNSSDEISDQQKLQFVNLYKLAIEDSICP